MKWIVKGFARLVSTAMLALLLVSTAYAEQKKLFGDYEVHYMGLTTTDLSPEVARQYGIVRSNALAYVNISVLKKGMAKAVDANVSGDMSNLIGQHKSLNFRRVQEGKAIYFFTTFAFDKNENYRFNIDISPKSAGKGKDIKLEFKQKFYSSN